MRKLAILLFVILILPVGAFAETAWYLIPYKTKPFHDVLARYVAVDDFTPQIRAAGGDWAEAEVLGNYAIVKVRAAPNMLTALAAQPGYFRLPLKLMDEPVARLPLPQRRAIRDRMEALGYSFSEIAARFPADWSGITLRDVLRFIASRRIKPRWDEANRQIVLDGPVVAGDSVDAVDKKVVE